MKYLSKIFLITGVLLFSSKLLWAHPPTNLQLTYNQDTKTLHVEMTHVVSNDRDPDHVRKILVSKNQEEPTSIYIVKQTTPTTVVQDISLDAKPGDKIHIEAFASRGGSAEGTLVVPEPESAVSDADKSKK